MSIVNYKNNPNNNSEYNDKEIRNNNSSVNPITDGEGRSAEVLNRPSLFDWGRTEIIRDALEAMWTDIVGRRFTVDVVARGWTGFYYNSGSGLSYSSGHICIPPGTSIKISMYGYPGYPATDTLRTSFYSLAGFKYKKTGEDVNGICIFLKPREYKREGYGSSDKVYYGNDIVVSFIYNSQASSVTVSRSGNIITVTYGSSSKYSDVSTALQGLSDFVYSVAVDDGDATFPSAANGLKIKVGETRFTLREAWANASAVTDTVFPFNMAAFDRYEIEIPYNVLYSFFTAGPGIDGLYPGDILYVKIPLSDILGSTESPDGNILVEDNARKHYGSYTLTSHSNIYISTNRNFAYQQAESIVSPNSHLIVPIARINSPSTSNLNAIAEDSGRIANSLIYCEWIDGVKVYPGGWHYDICEKAIEIPNVSTGNITLTTNTVENIAAENGFRFFTSFIEVSGVVHFENISYIVIKNSYDPSNIKIVKYNNHLKVNSVASDNFYSALDLDPSGKIIEIYNTNSSNLSVNIGGSKVCSATLIGSVNELASAISGHTIGNSSVHTNNSVNGSAIKDNSIEPDKMSSNDKPWYLRGSVTIEKRANDIINNYYIPHIFIGHDNVLTNESKFLSLVPIGIRGHIALGGVSEGSNLITAGPCGEVITLNLDVDSSVNIGNIVYYSGSKIYPAPPSYASTSIGILLDKNTTYKPVVVRGVVYITAAADVLAGSLLVISAASGSVVTKSSESYSVGIAVSDSVIINSVRYVLAYFWGYRKD